MDGTIVQEKTASRADSVFSFKMVVVQRDYIYIVGFDVTG